jgi:hypothetical protein
MSRFSIDICVSRPSLHVVRTVIIEARTAMGAFLHALNQCLPGEQPLYPA